MTLNLVQQKGLVTKYTLEKYEGPNSYQSKDMANVKVFADIQMDKPKNGQADGSKTICSKSIDAGA